jgi:cation transport ATPase
VLAAEVLDGLTVGRGRPTIQDLLDFPPRTVSVRRHNEVIEIPAEKLETGLRIGECVSLTWDRVFLVCPVWTTG